MKSPMNSGVELVRGGLLVGGKFVPIYAGSVHYWRLAPESWKPALLAVKSLGLGLVDTYIPWSVHEIAPGQLDLGERDPRLDVVRFIRLAEEVGLHVIARPGPHINAELTHFGIPERVVWDPACQARSPRQNPVVLPMLPTSFPVPSYASEVFLEEASRYFRELGKAVAPLVYPNGPIVMVQVDNEGALYFRDGVYDQDYHPDAVLLYRQFLRDKYKTVEAMADAYGFDASAEGAPRFADISPPLTFDAEKPKDLARHVDWAELQEHLLARGLERLAQSLVEAGFAGIPRTHNFPPGNDATPLNAARVSKSIDLIGLDYYGPASPNARTIIARRTSELAVRSDAHEVPAFACEMGAGFPPFFPPLEERDSAFTMLTALAYGLRAFNLYMAVERDRWIGAPFDPHGRERPFALFWRKLVTALDKTSFTSLRRRVRVRILVPRNERRLARVMHAFGPVPAAAFSISGNGAREHCLEDDLGLGFPPAVEADTFVRVLESALEARGVPFAHIGGEDREVSIDGTDWLVVVSSGGLSRSLFGKLEEAAQAGTLIHVGPRLPSLGGARRELEAPFDLSRLRRAGAEHDVLLGVDPSSVEGAVARAIDALSLVTYSCDPDGVYATVHEDEDGVARAAFVINPSDADVTARVTLDRAVQVATDMLKTEAIRLSNGMLEVHVKPKSVRFFGLT